MVREQRISAAVEHAGREIAHEGLGLDMEISEHLVRLPAAKEADAITVNIGAKESHCASSAEGPG